MARKRGIDGVMRRADAKLAFVANRWASAVPVPCNVEESGHLARCLRFTSGDFLFDELLLRYEVRSKLFATLFDLRCSFKVLSDRPSALAGGAKTAFDSREQALVGTCEGRRLMVPLNGLMQDRIQALGVLNIDARFLPDALQWSVEVGCLVGSATWNLIPPVLHLIEPTAEECIRATELMRMLARIYNTFDEQFA